MYTFSSRVIGVTWGDCRFCPVLSQWPGMSMRQHPEDITPITLPQRRGRGCSEVGGGGRGRWRRRMCAGALRASSQLKEPSTFLKGLGFGA